MGRPSASSASNPVGAVDPSALQPGAHPRVAAGQRGERAVHAVATEHGAREC